MRPFEIDISNRQKAFTVDCTALREVILQALQIEQVSSAVLSVSIVDNRAIHTVNRDHLQHDCPTDVISFQLGFERDDHFEEDDSDSADVPKPQCFSRSPDAAASAKTDASALRASGASIEGEIIASAETASEMAAEGRWSAQDELTLYIIHGLLHICGYDDLTPDEQTIMRSRERTILSATGRTVVYHEESEHSSPL